MGGKVQSGNFNHDVACSLVEATRQVAVAAAGTGPSGQKPVMLRKLPTAAASSPVAEQTIRATAWPKA